MKRVSKFVEDTNDEDYQRQLESWGKQIVRNESWASYRNLPMTQEIVFNLIKFVKTINRKLINEKNIDRSAYMADKSRCLWLIKMLSHNYQKELKLIEMSIDAELQELEI